MRKVLLILLAILALTGASFGAKPPKVETLPDGYLIVGQYMIYRTQLTQEIFDGALMTTSEVQKIYYKSEFANGTWFNIDESQELVEILMGGGGQAVDADWLNTLTYSVQIEEDGNVINFNEGENAQPIQEIINGLKAEQAKLEKDLDKLSGGGGEALAEQASDVAIRIGALNKSIGIDNSKEEEKKMLLELLAIASKTGNKALAEAVQSELVKSNPRLADEGIIVANLGQLLEEKQALVAMADQAKRNGFDELSEALAVELASKDEKIEAVIKDAQKAIASKGTGASKEAKDALNKAIAKKNALEVAGQEEIPETLIAAVEGTGNITVDILDKIFKKATLTDGTSTDKGSDTTDESETLSGDTDTKSDSESTDGSDTTSDDVDTDVDTGKSTDKPSGEQFALAIGELEGVLQLEVSKQLLGEVANQQIATLDPLLTSDVLDKNIDFGNGELETMITNVESEVYKLMQAIIAKENDFLEKVTLDGVQPVIDSLAAGEEISKNLESLSNALEGLNQSIISAIALKEELTESQEKGKSLISDIDLMIQAAKGMENQVLVEELTALRQRLESLTSNLYRDYSKDYLDYKKQRYFLLKDYKSNKEENHGTVLSDYTDAIASLDKKIQKIEMSGLVDLKEVNLGYEVWRLSYEGSKDEQKLVQEAYEKYKKEVIRLRDEKISIATDQLASLHEILVAMNQQTDSAKEVIDQVNQLRYQVEQLTIQLKRIQIILLK